MNKYTGGTPEMYDTSHFKVTEKRKKDHLEMLKTKPVEAKWATTLFECVTLIHSSLPELSWEELDISAEFSGKRFAAPLFITGMTGGAEEAGKINKAMAHVAEKLNIGFGLGSQRAMLENKDIAASYQVRDVAPNIFLAGNIGGVQLAKTPLCKVRELCDAVGANALCVHLNPAQEMLQPEGDRDFRGVIESVSRAVRELGLPVIVKETGAGIGRETAVRLAGAGVRFLDIAGLGGTSWVGVEILRSGKNEDPGASAFWDWGIPTAASLIEVRGLGFETICSGGIRTGLEAAKALAMGATLVGIAAPLLRAYHTDGEKGVEETLLSVIEGIKSVMVLTGCRTIAELRRAPCVIRGPLREWTEARRM